jgi:monovalent cation:H+ antiporter-2, CPA2 family
MHNAAFLQDLAVVMVIAGAVTVLFHRLKQPVVLGYIIAGVIIGPHTPPFGLIQDHKTIEIMSEMGVIFLLFSLGLEFSLRKLREVGATAFIAAFLEIVLMLWAGYEIGRLFGWTAMDSLFLGAMLSISSTTIIVKALADLGKAREKFAQLIFGILIVEDILAIALIALLSGVAMTGSLQAADVFLNLGRLGIFLIAAVVVGLLTIPRVIGYVARFKSDEMLLIAVLGLCFGLCLAAAKLGYSVALGAFLVGAVMAEARQIAAIHRLTEPIRDMFSAVFFVAIGLLIDPRILVQYAVPIVVITVAVVVGKVVTCSFGTFVAGHNPRTAMRVGMGLAQIGEFSFIIAALGVNLKVTSPFLYPIAVTVSAITTLLTPYLIRSSDTVVARLGRIAPRGLVNIAAVYTQWLGARAARPSSMAAQLLRRWTWQMALNIALCIATFTVAIIVSRKAPERLIQFAGSSRVVNPILWLAASLVCLPLLIATFRKLQAVGLLLAQSAVAPAAAGERTAAVRSVISQAIPMAGLVAMALIVLALSSALLPATNTLLVLGILVFVVAMMMWRTFIKLYSKAQYALVETLSQPPPPHRDDQPRQLSDLLAGAELKPIVIRSDSPAAGRLIAELRLRTLTGASIVGIQRNGVSIVNPGPEDDLQAGDKVLLLGTQAHLTAAESYLIGRTTGSAT